MIQRYEADAARVITMGFSQGAAVSYALSLAQPDLMCGVIALAGFIPNYPIAPLRSDSPAETWVSSGTKALQPSYLIVHGSDDDIVPIALAREARSALEARGALVEYHEYPGGHKVSAQGLKDIARWITTTLHY
jgi:phospholipase/carboxylesterase